MHSPVARLAAPIAIALVAACSDVGRSREAIQGGVPATDYPEAVYVTSEGFIPCSGVLLAPTVVLSAGHCRGNGTSFVVTAPNAGNVTVTGSRSWSPFDDDVATSSDVLLIFLDAPIQIASYPTLSPTEVAPGTSVVDIGRTLNGSIDTNDYVSPPVTIQGDATPLGFPYNYEALPDISEDGDSGGPIVLQGTHTIVAIVDTDTVEQSIQETTPIDLFARIDVVKDAIDEQIASNGETASGGCSVAAARGSRGAVLALVAWVLAFLARRSRVNTP